jgi:protein gp37
MGKTDISWTDYSFNPVTGCTPISEGCRHCYAQSIAKRFAGTLSWPNGFNVTLHPERLVQPLRWKTPRRVFLCSAGDLFHEAVPFEFVTKVWAVMLLSSDHTFQVLTKRPDRMLEFLRQPRLYDDVLREANVFRRQRPKMANVGISNPATMPRRWIWLGVTAENQVMADQRIPLLLQVPAAVRFVSVEPMLSAMDLRPYLTRACTRWQQPLHNGEQCPECGNGHGNNMGLRNRLDWVICGGETGPGARPMHPGWARSLRDQCQASGTPFFFKQRGEWAPATAEHGVIGSLMPETGGKYTWIGWDGKTQNPSAHGLQDPVMAIARVGKARAGHLLDGQEWRQFPESRG